MSAVTLQKSEWDTGSIEKFRTLAIRYQQIGREAGINIRPFLSADLPLFQEATLEQRKIAVDSLEIIVSIHEETIAAGEKAVDFKKLLWRALKRFDLIPGPDLFTRMKDNDEIVIIYNEEQRILFWTLQFFKKTSFTVEQMFFLPWHECTKRPDHIHASMYQLAVGLITGKIQGCFVPDVPAHEVEELNSAERLKTMMSFPLISSLTRDGKFGGFLVVQRMEILG
jgi:hypothetical protein